MNPSQQKALIASMLNKRENPLELYDYEVKQTTCSFFVRCAMNDTFYEFEVEQGVVELWANENRLLRFEEMKWNGDHFTPPQPHEFTIDIREYLSQHFDEDAALRFVKYHISKHPYQLKVYAE